MAAPTSVEFHLRLDQAAFNAAVGQVVTRWNNGVNEMDRTTRSTSERIRNSLRNAFDIPTMTAGAAAMAAGLTATAKEAISLEAAMANVAKVVDFPESNGLKSLETKLLELSRHIPITAAGLAEIAAAGGQLGVAGKDLPAFVEQVAKIATAFDMLPEKAGESMAKIANIFNIPITKIESFGNVINTLSNNTAAKASEIVDALTRIGGTTEQFGLAREEAAALAAAFIALGKPPEVAATAINALLSKLQVASEGSKDFKEALTGLGYSAEGLQKSIGQNAQQTLSEFLAKLGALDKQTRAIALTKLFGAEYQDDISILVGSLGKYNDTLALVNDKSKVAGSIQAEFSAKAATTANKLQLLSNQADELKIRIGQGLLPILNKILGPLGDMATYLANLANESPRAAVALTAIGTALGGMLAFSGVTALLGSIGTTLGVAGTAAAGATAAVTGLGAAMTGALAVAATAGVVGVGMFGNALWEAEKAETALEERTKTATQAFQTMAGEAPKLAELLTQVGASSAKILGLTDQELEKLQALIRVKMEAIATERTRLELEEQRPVLGLLTDHTEKLRGLTAEEQRLTEVLRQSIEVEKSRKSSSLKSLDAQKVGVQAVSTAVDGLKEKTTAPIPLKLPSEEAIGNLNRVSEATDRLKEKLQTPAPVQVESSDAKEKIDQVTEATDQLKEKIQIPADVQVDSTDAKQVIQEIVQPDSKLVSIQTDTTSVTEAMERIKTAMDGVANTKILLSADSSAVLDHIAKIQSGLDGLANKEIALLADASDALKKNGQVREAMESLGDRTVNVEADVGNALSGIDDVRSALNDLADKTVTVTTRHVEEHAGGGWAGIRTLANGGRLPGFGGGDRVPALLEAGEFVVRKERARLFSGLLHLMNFGPYARVQQAMTQLPKFQTGGMVPGPVLTLAAGGAVVRLQAAGMTAQDPIERTNQEVAAYRRAAAEKVRIAEEVSDARLQIEQQELQEKLQNEQREMDTDIRLEELASIQKIANEAKESEAKTVIHQQESRAENEDEQAKADARVEIRQQESTANLDVSMQESRAKVALAQQESDAKARIAENEAAERRGESQNELSRKNAESQANVAREHTESMADMAQKTAESQAEMARENAESQNKISRENAESQAKTARDNAQTENKIARDAAESQAKIARENTESQSKIARENGESQAEMAREDAKTQTEIDREDAATLAEMERKDAISQADMAREEAETQTEMARKEAESQAEITREDTATQAEMARKDAASAAEIQRTQQESDATLAIEATAAAQRAKLKNQELLVDQKIAEQRNLLINQQKQIFTQAMEQQREAALSFRVSLQEQTPIIQQITAAILILKQHLALPNKLLITSEEAAKNLASVTEIVNQLKQKLQSPIPLNINIANVQQAIQALIKPESKLITVEGNTTAVQEKIEFIKKALEQLANREILLTANNSAALEQTAKVQEAMATLKNRELVLSVDSSGTSEKIAQVREAMNGLTNKTVTVQANVSAALSNIGQVQSALDSLTDKTITVTTQYVEQHAGGGWAGLALARGGRLPGFGGGDRIPAVLEAGEFVVRKERARLFSGLLNLMNSGPISRIQKAITELPQFHAGGIVNHLRLPEIPTVAFAAGGAVQSGPVERFDIRLNGRPMAPTSDAPSQLRGLLNELKEGSRGLLP